MISTYSLLQHAGKAYLVCGWAFETAPTVRILAYRVDAHLDDCDGRRAYKHSGSSTVSYRGFNGLDRSVYLEGGKGADLILDVDVPVPRGARGVPYWGSGAWFVPRAAGPKLIERYEGEYLRGWIAAKYAGAAQAADARLAASTGTL